MEIEMFTAKNPSARALWLALALLLPALPAAAQRDEARGDESSYGYFRVLEGSATLVEADAKTRSPIEINQPVLAGDQVLVAKSSRLEVVLPDGTLVRLDGGSDLTFVRIAGSPDSDDPLTQLTLAEGELQLVVPDDFAGDEPPRIDTPNATFYPRGLGVFRVTSESEDWSSLLVREGSAEAVTRRGSLVVRAGEEALVDSTAGDELPQAEVQTASSTDGLERWGRRLDEEAEASEYVADDLRYEAAPLGRYGSWIDVEGSRYWRPTSVDTGWRPFWHGRWVSTPSGLTWIAYEPWGWVTSHYGSWDYLPYYGWAWRPGYTYSPAWVYWYWGPRYVGWCPTGYYTRFYGRRHHGFRFGLYGWAGGDWGAFGDWNFVPATHVGSRDQHRWARRGRDLGREHGGNRLDQGLITTDTRPVDIGRYREPAERLRILRERRGRGGEELPDVTPFIARQPELPPRVLRNVVADGPGTQVLERTSPRPERPGRGAGRRASGTVEPGGAGSPEPWRLRMRTGESPKPGDRAGAGSPTAGAGREDAEPTRDGWRDRSGRPRIEIGGRRGDAGDARQPRDTAPAERRGQGDSGERAQRERPRRAEPGDGPGQGSNDEDDESAPRGRLRTAAPEERPGRERAEERPREQPRQAEPEERPDRGAAERGDRGGRDERVREERPRAEEPRERPQVEIRERGPEQERPRIETRERPRDRRDDPPARVLRNGGAGEELTPRRSAEGGTGGEAWRQRAESWRRTEPGPVTGGERREYRAPRFDPRFDPGTGETRRSRPSSPAVGQGGWRPRPAPRAGGRETWRPAPLEPASPRVYVPPVSRRPAERPAWTPPSRPQAQRGRPAYSAPPPRSAPSARPAPPPAGARDRGDRGNHRGGGRPRN